MKTFPRKKGEGRSGWCLIVERNRKKMMMKKLEQWYVYGYVM
jgi:hypothetical protein